jgi:hypothetical protein
MQKIDGKHIAYLPTYLFYHRYFDVSIFEALAAPMLHRGFAGRTSLSTPGQQMPNA